LATLFKWITNAFTLVEVDVRLDYLATKHPVLKDYFLTLKRRKKYWASAHMVWRGSFGLRASSLMENVNWSMKAAFNFKRCPAVDFPGKLHGIMYQRKLKISATSLRLQRAKVNKAWASSSGYNTLFATTNELLTPYAHDFLMTELQASQVAVVETIDLTSALNELANVQQTGNLKRFELLLRNMPARKYSPKPLTCHLTLH